MTNYTCHEHSSKDSRGDASSTKPVFDWPRKIPNQMPTKTQAAEHAVTARCRKRWTRDSENLDRRACYLRSPGKHSVQNVIRDAMQDRMFQQTRRAILMSNRRIRTPTPQVRTLSCFAKTATDVACQSELRYEQPPATAHETRSPPNARGICPVPRQFQARLVLCRGDAPCCLEIR